MKTPNPTPKKPKQSARREKPTVGPGTKDKEKSEDPSKQPAERIVTTTQKDATAKPSVGAPPKLATTNKKTGGLAGKIKDMLF